MSKSYGNTLPHNTYELPHFLSLKQEAEDPVSRMARLQYFIMAAPSYCRHINFGDEQAVSPFVSTHHIDPIPGASQLRLPNGEHVTCIAWSGVYYISGTDIVRILLHRFQTFGRPVQNLKKFEESVFSDLRNLKPGRDASLEEPKSALLELLFKLGCIRTQKKQKVFFWFNVPHDRLFLDALERDLKREKLGFTPTSCVTGEPASTFVFDPSRSLHEQFAGRSSIIEELHDSGIDPNHQSPKSSALRNSPAATAVLRLPQLHRGSPAYKQRKRKASLDLKPSPESQQTRSLRQSSAPSATSAPFSVPAIYQGQFPSRPRIEPRAAVERSTRPSQLSTGRRQSYLSLPRGKEGFVEQTAADPQRNSVSFDVPWASNRNKADLGVPKRAERMDCTGGSPHFAPDELPVEAEKALWQPMIHTSAEQTICFRCSQNLGECENLGRHLQGPCAREQPLPLLPHHASNRGESRVVVGGNSGMTLQGSPQPNEATNPMLTSVTHLNQLSSHTSRTPPRASVHASEEHVSAHDNGMLLQDTSTFSLRGS